MTKKEANEGIVLATMHRACFVGIEPPVWAYFIRITNLLKEDIWVTNVGMKYQGEYFAAEPPERLLPRELEPNEPWETWIEFDKLPTSIHNDPYRLGRVTLSTGETIETEIGRHIPPRGEVPGGPVRPEYSLANKSEEQEQQIPPEYDTQQVCVNGHKITGCYHRKPQDRKDYCHKCGKKTVITCSHCHEEIPGDRIVRLSNTIWKLDKRMHVPSYCANCGKPYPWTKERIDTAIKKFKESDKLDREEQKTIEQDIENITKDTPEAELSARRIKRFVAKCGPVTRELVMEFASRTAATILKGPYP